MKAMIADAIARRGCQPVALMLPTCREYFTTFPGALFAGAVPVPIYPPTRLAPLQEHLERQSRILDNGRATRRELPERTEGHIQFRGPSATTGYFRNPIATTALFHGDWLDTGSSCAAPEPSSSNVGTTDKASPTPLASPTSPGPDVDSPCFAALEPTGIDWHAAVQLRDSARAHILRRCGEPDPA